MKLKIFFCSLTVLLFISEFSQSQPFHPDKYGYVAGNSFLNYIKKEGFQLVSAFDTLFYPGTFVAKAMLNNSWVTIDVNGEVNKENQLNTIYKPVYDRFGDAISIAAPFETTTESAKNDVFKTVIVNGKFGTVNTKTNETGLSAIYDGVSLLGYGIAKIRINDKTGVAFTSGEVIKNPEYDEIRIIHLKEKQFVLVQKGKYKGLISVSGEEIFPTEYSEISHCISCSENSNLIILQKDKKYGIGNIEGKVITPPTYGQIRYFKNELLIITKESNSPDTKYGLIDSLGNMILNPVYDRLEYDYKSKTIKTQTGKLLNRVFGIVDITGKTILDTQYSNIYYNQENNTFIIRKDEKIGLADINGNIIIPAEYESVYYGENVIFAKKDGKYGVMNKQGTVIFPLIYEQIYEIPTGFVFMKDQEWAKMNSKGKNISKIPYESLQRSVNGLYYTVAKDGKYGILDTDLKIIFPIKFDQIYNTYTPVRQGIAEVSIKKSRYYADRYGNLQELQNVFFED